MITAAIVGATGAVGQELRRVLLRRGLPAGSVRLLASPRSAGQRVAWSDRTLVVEALGPDSFRDVKVAYFSAGSAVSRQHAPRAVETGAVVIDNSSEFRMRPDVPLVVPEINPQAARQHRGIVANPNCSTIILAVPLWPLHRANPVRRVVVSTYQAVSGAGARAMQELESQTRAVLSGAPPAPQVLPHPCAFNVFSHNSALDADGFNLEESKIIKETHKIFGDTSIAIAPTCMRVPVLRAHLETVAVEFSRPITAADARRILSDAPGVCVVDDRPGNRFPMPVDASGRDEILVGRFREDPTVPDGRGLHFICCGDQLLKGAALNAVQISDLLT